MFNNVEAIFQSFLDGIRMSKQSVVKRDKFSRIWNEWALNQWVKANLSIKEGYEYSDKQFIDLQSLIVSTDGIYVYNGSTVYPIASETGKTNVFSVPTLDSPIMNTDGRSYLYPLLKSIKKVWVNNGTIWVEASPLKAISENFTKNSHYTGPSAKRVYYKLMNDKVYIDNGSSFTATAIRYEYLRYPNLMSYDTSANTLSYTIDLGQDQLEEIRDEAVRLYLERTTDPRYKSFFNEDLVKTNSRI